MPLADHKIAIVGASGAVGREALSILSRRGHPVDQIELFGSQRSSGLRLRAGESEMVVNEFTPEKLGGCDVALLCTGAGFSAEFGPGLRDRGLVVVDNSSAFRAHPDIPLVIPEINGHMLVHDGTPSLLANPNCSTIMMLVALEPIRRAFGLKSVIVSTYQAVSGAGYPAIEELQAETHRAINGEPARPCVFPETCAFNVFQHESDQNVETGYRGEEQKMVTESRRVLGIPDLEVLPTCVRVPVERCHAQSIVVDTESPASRDALVLELDRWAAADVSLTAAVTPRNTEHTDRVRIGAVRASDTLPDTRFSLWICCDQLRKGAALNAIDTLDLYLASA